MKKSFLIFTLASLSVCALAAGAVFGARKGSQLLTRATGSGEWVHYTQKDPTASELGTREYWIECGGAYQFTAPLDVTPTEGGNNPDRSEFAVDDDRYIPFKMDEDHTDLSIYAFGAGMYLTSASDYKNWRATFGDGFFNCNLYSDGGNKLLWRIDLPRIDYTRYPTVTMNVIAPNWYENNMMGPEADQLTYHTNFGGNKTEGKIKLTLGPSGLHMEFNSLEYASTLAFENTFTDSDIINGLKSAYFYTEDLYDRYLNVQDITLSTAVSPVAVMHLGGDTTKVTVTNGTASLPSGVDYSIISNGYASNDTGLLLEGNANPGALVATFPAVDLDSNLATGVVVTKFGVRNNSEHMYWGSGESRVDLGTNSPSSQDDNNNGYVNWVLVVMDGVSYIHNVYENKNYIVSLTAGMRDGTEGIVISGGNTSIYRRYLVTDFNWQLTPDYPLVAPNVPQDVYSYAGDKTKLSVVNGAVSMPGSTDYSIINNGYATNDTGLCVQGNANPGAAVITLPAFNMKPYAEVGKVTFKFGVSNNNEHMYWGSGASRVDLGTNSPTSQSENNNGYINWELVVTASGAYVHNTYADQNINVSLTAGMRAGTESIVISGGDTSVYRTYLVTDFYWSAF